MTTDFTAWATGLGEVCPGAAGCAGVCLVALTGAGPVLVATGDGLDDLCRRPVDRLALVPSTYGGMVVLSCAPGSARSVCADPEGGVVVLAGGPLAWTATTSLGADDVDHDAVALLWRLMDVAATRPDTAELVARLLCWAWLAHPDRALGDDVEDEGVRYLADGDLGALAELVGVTLPARLDAEVVRLLATTLGHPALDWDRFPWVVDEEQRLEVLHACLPTRWALADELRTHDGRVDLAEVVMAAPAPPPWSTPVG